MKSSIKNKLKSLIRNKHQVHLELDIPYSDPINGYPIKIEGELLLLQSLSDFKLDGYDIVRIDDILKLRSNKYERFAEKVLRGEKELEKLSIPLNVKLNDWKAALESLRKTKEYIIVEWFDEKEDDAVFFIGQINRLNKNTISFKQFDATGKWLKPWPVPYKNIINQYCPVSKK